MKNKYKFIIKCEPVAKGRPRVTRRGFTYTPAKTKQFENYLKLYFATEYHGKQITEPIYLKADFYKSIPKSFSKKKTIAAENKIIRPATKPDIDNYFKALCDGMNKIIIKDDSQIVSAEINKYYSKIPRIEIEIKIIEK